MISSHSKKQPKFATIQSSDGPPVDLSFKKMRTLAQLLTQKKSQTKDNVPSGKNQKKQQTKTATNIPQSSLLSEKTIGEEPTEIRLNIIRTIQVTDNKIIEATKSGFNKKVQKAEKKPIKNVEVKTTSFFLRYNKLTSIDGLSDVAKIYFPSLSNIVWIDLSHNRITKLVDDFAKFEQLKNLYLHANYIANFKEFQKLQSNKLLRTFTIHGNPIENYGQFRVFLSCMLPNLQKLDSNLLTKRDRQRGEIMMKQIKQLPAKKKYPIIQNPHLPPQESDEQDQA